MTGASLAQIRLMDKHTKATSRKVIGRVVPLLAMWGFNRFLETPKVRGALHEVDSRAVRSVRRVGRNAISNPAWLAAGAAAIAVGLGLMAKAARGK